MDPPRHSRVRRVAATASGPRVVKNFDPWVREIITEALDNIEGRDEFDYVTEIAQIVPSAVIAQIQGVPREDRGWIVDRTVETFAVLTKGDMETTMKTVGEVQAYYREKLVPQKRREPKNDMTTVLLHAGPPMFMSRTAAEDTELGGQRIRKGDLINLYFVAANRYP